MPCHCITGDCSSCSCQTANTRCTPACHGGNINRSCVNTSMLTKAKFLIFVTGFVTLICAVILQYITSDPIGFITRSQRNLKRSDILASTLQTSTVSSIELNRLIKDGEFVSRDYLEPQIKYILSRTKPIGKYFIVYGAKGEGKSMILDYSVKGHTGVAKIFVTSANTKDDIIKSLAKLCDTDDDNVDINDFVTALSKGSLGNNKMLTIVFEIERGGALDQVSGVQAVRSLAKSFATVANCIIILSEATAVLEFGKDSAREEFIFVPGFSDIEARDYLKKLKLVVDDTEISYIFENIGTSPAMLRDMEDKINNEGWTVEDYVENKLAEARTELIAFSLKPILAALKENLDGVNPEFSKNIKYEGVDLSDPRAVGLKMKDSNAIIYRIEKRQYQLISKAHEIALKSYMP